MQRSFLAAIARHVVSYLAMAVITVVSLPALGADPTVERQAQTLQKKALEEDSLNINYPEAIKKLATAISRCGADKCSATLRGALYRDLGAMLVLSGSVDDGRAAFVKALGLDSSLELDPSYKNQMLEGLWNDAKKKAGVGGGPSTSGGAAPSGPPETSASEQGSAQQPQG
ncbi:MAG: hypothetical protein M3O46_23870, partial [Myxococcota bacterium]|nr:hypothetical protein [Myxococcota bacterium]